MILVALTGGIGSGKSSVSGGLSERGAVVVDADAIVHMLQQPDMPVYEAMVDRWGQHIVRPDRSLDRQAVASIVFSDEAELEALNSIVHPAVRTEMRRQMDDLASTRQVVILDIPLLAEGSGDRRGASAVIVVDCPVETAIDRLVAYRDFDRSDAAARVAAQATREQRLALADFVVDNSGSLDQLADEVERCWEWLASMDETPWPPASV